MHKKKMHSFLNHDLCYHDFEWPFLTAHFTVDMAEKVGGDAKMDGLWVYAIEEKVKHSTPFMLKSCTTLFNFKCQSNR